MHGLFVGLRSRELVGFVEHIKLFVSILCGGHRTLLGLEDSSFWPDRSFTGLGIVFEARMPVELPLIFSGLCMGFSLKPDGCDDVSSLGYFGLCIW
jgi:hypothetical protein